MKIKRNILFFIDKEGTKEAGYKPDGKVRLRIRYVSGKIDFNAGYRAELSKWNTETQRCKAGTTHGKKKISASEINKEIQRLEVLTDDVFKSFEVIEHIPTLQEYRNEFNKANNKTTGEEIVKQDFFSLFNEFTKECGFKNNWTESTYRKFGVVKNHLQRYNKDLTFDYFDEKGLSKYSAYLRDVLDMRNSTIKKQISCFLKWFLRWAYKKGYHNTTAYEDYKPNLRTTKQKIIFLTWKELTQLREYQIPESKQYLERVRDVFLFQCFTGLRYSDVYNLKRSDVKENHIEITTVKTADSLIIELNSHSRTILEKYKDVHFSSGKVLPVISNQKMNEYLKELAELAEINEPIRETYYKGNQRIDETMPKYALLGTHAGRRTFICNALSLGIPAQVVMKWTGHSDYKAMKPYIDIADEIKASAMSKFDEI